MAKTNIWIHEGGAKVRWLFALASRDNDVIRPEGGEPLRLPDEFPRHANWKDFAAALGTTSPNLNNWFPTAGQPSQADAGQPAHRRGAQHRAHLRLCAAGRLRRR